MARGRMISKSLSTSEKFASVSGHLVEFCHALYPLLIPHTDDFGRLQGDPFTVKHQCYPASVRSLDEFADALLELHRVELIRWYVVGGKRYIQIENFDPHQLGLHKRTRSHFPDIPGNSGKVPEIPSEEKRREQEQEEKGTRTRTNAPAALVRSDRLVAAHETAHSTGQALQVTAGKLRDTLGDLRASFEEFWDRYPRQKSKKQAEKAWLRIHPDEMLYQRIRAELEVQRVSADWLEKGGKFVPYPASWLNGARWEDQHAPPGPVLSDRTLRLAQAGKGFLES